MTTSPGRNFSVAGLGVDSVWMNMSRDPIWKLCLPLKRVAIFQIRSSRFSFLILRMSLSRNRCPLSGDML
jgi:hypothetical protein